MKLRIWPLLLSTLLLFMMLSTIAYAEDKTTFSLNSPASPIKVGDEIAITVEGHNVKDVYGYELRLSYDPNVWSFRQASTTWKGFTVPPIVENGNLTFAHTKIGNSKGESGTVPFATLRFEAIGQGDSAIRLTRVKLVNSGGSSTTEEPSLVLPVNIATKNPVNYLDTKGHWAEKDIARATEMGWINGYPDGRFAPQNEINRAQFTTMLARALALSSQSDLAQTFTDHEQIPAYAKAHVSQAVAAGLTQGYEDATFRPARSITRSEITVMLMRVLGYEDKMASNPPLAYEDADQVPEWAYPAVAAASDMGIVKGRDNNKFAPGDYTTRAEAVTLILRIVDRISST
ncbi:S-layer homology domain-containing protein [Paenibacillus soyae]|uniref:S-layer homology domain-containing protein n=1 Tax=Paenibacillus soyae TaxID=2969249 RepID=A0A9X2MWZ7_9BACL|nr:S-layer homology domain-containing protein [Paenibacillus soyae]MCR2807975.1 S-layer homology domain-containing protein [Paenibacillus soyae]